jgi:hypothetical protein
MMIRLFGLVILMLAVVIFYSLNYLNDYQEGKIKEAHGVSKSDFPCNCTLDFMDKNAGFELPKVEVLQSKSEAPLEWTESQELGMDGILIGDTYLGNYSAGDLVDLNTINVAQNQPLGLEISGGALPDIVNAEILHPITDMNRTNLKIGEIAIDKKVSDSFVLFNKSLEEPTLEQNSFRVETPPQGGHFVLLVSLLYNYQPISTIHNGTNNATSNSNLLAIYKSVLSAG